MIGWMEFKLLRALETEHEVVKELMGEEHDEETCVVCKLIEEARQQTIELDGPVGRAHLSF